MEQTRVTGRRTVAWLVDVVPSAVLFVVGVRTFGEEVPAGTVATSRLQASLGTGDTLHLAQGGAAAAVFALVLGWGVANLVLLQGVTGASVGKLVTGLRVVGGDGRACGPGRAALRWLLLVVDAFPYLVPLVGLVTVLATPDRRRLGDRAAGTGVVTASSVGRPPAQAAQQAPAGAEPQWDAARGAWVRWDGTAWVQHDRASDRWVPLR